MTISRLKFIPKINLYELNIQVNDLKTIQRFINGIGLDKNN